MRCCIDSGSDESRTELLSDNNSRFALQDIHFEIKSGEVTALVGDNGSGKSTIVDLLYRFYDLPNINTVPPTGVIEIDNIDIRNIKLDDIRRQIGIASMYSHIFKFRTIRENIFYGRSDNRTVEDILDDLRVSELSISGLEPEQKQGISSGQGQQIRLLRALLRRPSIYIFDEPTANLDEKSRELVRQKIYSLRDPSNIVILISHDLSDIKEAEHVVKLDKGRIVEDNKPPVEIDQPVSQNPVILIPRPRTPTTSDQQGQKLNFARPFFHAA